jgi:hypothetical protein
MASQMSQSHKVSQRNKMWLLKVENLTIVRECRKHIQREFGIKLHLDADDLLQNIENYADRSKDPTLRRLSRPIARLLRGNPEDSESFELAHIPVVAKTDHIGWNKTSR